MEVTTSSYWFGLISVVFALMVFCGLIQIYYWHSRLKKRYSPFTEDSLRLPGHTLRQRHNELSDDLLLLYFGYIITAVVAVLAFTFLSSALRTITVLSAVGVMLFLLRKVWCLFEVLRSVRLGREGEEYVGQELNLLMCRDAHVFHDIPYVYGNIDHIVIGNDKVFVVETKAISKPQAFKKASGRESKVVFDGHQLVFPHMKTDVPIKQSKQHAEYVRKILKKNCGLDIDVVPVVALPGWFVESGSAGSEVLVINPKRGKALDKWLGISDCKITKNKVAVYFASVARSISARSVLTDPDASSKYDFWFNPRHKETGLV